MKTANPYLNFAGNTEEAFEFYKSMFGGEFLAVIRFKDFGDNSMGVPEKDQNKIAHIALPLGKDTMLMGTDTLESLGQSLAVGNNFYIFLEAESADEAERLLDALSESGQVEMPLQKTEWAEKYGMCTDKFGVPMDGELCRGREPRQRCGGVTMTGNRGVVSAIRETIA